MCDVDVEAQITLIQLYIDSIYKKQPTVEETVGNYKQK